MVRNIRDTCIFDTFTHRSHCSFVSRSCSKQQLDQFSTQQMMEQSGGPVWEALWLCMCALDVLQMRVTEEEFNYAKMYGLHAELFFFILRRGTDPIEPRHVSTASLFSPPSFAQPEGLPPARNDALGGSSWPRASGLVGPARTGTFYSDPHAGLTSVLKVSHQHHH